MKPLKPKPPANAGKYDLKRMSMQELYKEFGLDANIDFNTSDVKVKTTLISKFKC